MKIGREFAFIGFLSLKAGCNMSAFYYITEKRIKIGY